MFRAAEPLTGASRKARGGEAEQGRGLGGWAGARILLPAAGKGWRPRLAREASQDPCPPPCPCPVSAEFYSVGADGLMTRVSRLRGPPARVTRRALAPASGWTFEEPEGEKTGWEV